MGNQFIDFAYVKEHANFEAVLAHFNIKTVGSGGEVRALCPFHEERKPSLSINLEKKVFHCFGCEAKGNILEFVRMMEGENLRQAAVVLADCCDIDLCEKTEQHGGREEGSEMPAQTRKRGRRGQGARKEAKATSDRSRPAKRQSRTKGKDEAGENEPLTFTLKLEPEHPYGKERDLSSSIVEHFEMGYCSRGMMKGRWCIPIHDVSGEVVAYVGRWADRELPDDVEKYMLPPKFRKSDVLFNLHRLSETEHVVVVEGFFDAIRLHAMGVPVVSVMGTSISDAQVALLVAAGTRYVTVMFDGNEAGDAGCEAVVNRLASEVFVRAAMLSDGEDPASADEEELRGLVEPVAIAA